MDQSPKPKIRWQRMRLRHGTATEAQHRSCTAGDGLDGMDQWMVMSSSLWQWIDDHQHVHIIQVLSGAHMLTHVDAASVCKQRGKSQRKYVDFISNHLGSRRHLDDLQWNWPKKLDYSPVSSNMAEKSPIFRSMILPAPKRHFVEEFSSSPRLMTPEVWVIPRKYISISHDIRSPKKTAKHSIPMFGF